MLEIFNSVFQWLRECVLFWPIMFIVVIPLLFLCLGLGIVYIIDFIEKKKWKDIKNWKKKDDEQWYEYEKYDYHPTHVHYFSEKFRYNSIAKEILDLREGESKEAFVNGVPYRFTCVSMEYTEVGSSYYDESEAYAMEKEWGSLGVFCSYIKVELV